MSSVEFDEPVPVEFVGLVELLVELITAAGADEPLEGSDAGLVGVDLAAELDPEGCVTGT